MNKNVWLLFASNACAFSVAPVTVFLSGIIGSSMSPIKSLSTLPMSLSIVGTALFIIAASKIMSITGRKKGFILASITTSIFARLGPNRADKIPAKSNKEIAFGACFLSTLSAAAKRY